MRPGTADAFPDYRRYFAEEIRVVANLQSPLVVDALAATARERFLPPGPWTIRGEFDVLGPPRHSTDADPRHVHHNVSVAIDETRMLFNGAPALLAGCIDALSLTAGSRVLHIGTGLGYYTAVMAHCVGPTGHVTGIEVDPALADGARRNLAGVPWVTIHQGNGTRPPASSFDAILVNAGVTHPLPPWLDALAPGGQLMLPVTVTTPVGGPIGKGPMVLLTRTADPQRLAARLQGRVMIYSALGIRDESRQAAILSALTTNPLAALTVARLDEHVAGPDCWLHQPGFCLCARRERPM